MCGIAGAMTKTGRPPSDQALSAMQEALRHRGPDGEGRFGAGSTAMVHTRLAVIDPDRGIQPFVADDGTALVANGEIYNDLAVRADLADVSYKTGSDNESALHLYRRHGLKFVRHLRGMYALALYDPTEERLVLARDPFGIKPLYLSETPDAFWFASEPQALLAAGVVPRTENEAARDQLLALQFTCGAQTVFKDIVRLEPGETVVIKRGHVVERIGMESISTANQAQQDSLSQFDNLWMDSIDLHRRSDVPYGVFLSGGTDSASVLTAMARLEDRPVIAFTAGFGGTKAHDERDQAARLAEAVGAVHCPMEIGADDFWENLPAIAATLDDPVADYAIVPTYLLAKEAAKDVKVVLTGEGGDEIFGGYGRYRSGRRPWPLRRQPWARHNLALAGVLRDPSNRWRDELRATERKTASRSLTPLQRLQALDISHWLPNDLLTKVDRCLMAHGVEGRVPFLDGPLAAFGFSLSDHDKIKGRLGKQIIRRWLAAHRPEAQPFARKRGFSVPVGEWIVIEGQRLAPLVARQDGVAACCDSEAVARFFRNVTADKAFPAWVLLFYALWHQCHIMGVGTSATVLDVLAEN